MRKIILFSVIQQSLFFISRVESLIGHHNFTAIRGGEFPFIASFQYFPGEHNFCGGALITKKHVITAAYCLENTPPESFRIVFEVAHAEEPSVAYTAASWTTYNDWIRGQVMPYGSPQMYGDLVIVTLTDRVYNVNPVPLNRLTKRQLAGEDAIMIGWKNDVLSKATVELFSDEDCERSIRLLDNDLAIPGDVLCSIANPMALLYHGDMGSPLIYARDNSLLGIAYGFCPGDVFVPANLSIEFIREHQVNVHTSVDYYRLFVRSVIPAAPGA